MDTRIALGYQPIQIPDQSAPLQKALTLQALMGQQELQGLQIGEAQRAARKSAALDALIGSAKTDEEFETGYARIDPLGAAKLKAERLKAGLEAKKAQGDLTEQSLKMAAGMAGGFLSLPKEQRAANYPAFAAEWTSKGLPGTPPAQWDESLVPNLQRWAAYTLPAANVQERADYAATAQNPTVKALQQQPDVTATPLSSHDENVQSMQTEMRQAGLDPTTTQAPTVGVQRTAPAETPTSLRARAQQLRTQGTKAANDVAKDLEMEANRIEGRGLEEQKLEDAKKTREEAAAGRKATQGQKDREFENKLGDDFKAEPLVKQYRTVQPVINSLREAAKRGGPGASLNITYGVSKIFDPESVVREGEQIMVVNAGGLPSQVQSAIQWVNGGGKLTPEMIESLMAEVESRVAGIKQAHDQLATSYRKQAVEQNLNPDRVVRIVDVKPTGQGPRKPGAGSGTQSDPFRISGDDGWSLVKPGQFYTAPDGSLRQKK